MKEKTEKGKLTGVSTAYFDDLMRGVPVTRTLATHTEEIIPTSGMITYLKELNDNGELTEGMLWEKFSKRVKPVNDHSDCMYVTVARVCEDCGILRINTDVCRACDSNKYEVRKLLSPVEKKPALANPCLEGDDSND